MKYDRRIIRIAITKRGRRCVVNRAIIKAK